MTLLARRTRDGSALKPPVETRRTTQSGVRSGVEEAVRWTLFAPEGVCKSRGGLIYDFRIVVGRVLPANAGELQPRARNHGH